MDHSCTYLFNAAADTSSNGCPEGAINFLDRCICSGPTPDLAVHCYFHLYNEIWKAFELKDRNLNLQGSYRQWAIRATAANSRVIQIYNKYVELWDFDQSTHKLAEIAGNNAFADGVAMRLCTAQEEADALKLREYSSKRSADPIEMPINCTATAWDKLEIFIPGNWDGFPENDLHFPEFVVKRNDTGELRKYTCNPAKLDSSQHNFPNTPHHMDETYFHLDVLEELSRAGLFDKDETSHPVKKVRSTNGWERWELEIYVDEDEDKCVIVRLGEIGRCLPWNLRRHFERFNITPVA